MAFKKIHKIFEELVDNISTVDRPVYFMYEKEQKAFQILTTDSKDSVYKDKKYPLVLMIAPVQEKDSKNGDYNVDFSLAIVTDTKPEWTSSQRYTTNFDAILTPIYDDLIDQICQCVNIWQSNHRKIKPDKLDNIFTTGGELRMPDNLDAIMVKFKDIQVCNTFTAEGNPITTFTLTTSSGTGGTIEPGAGVQSYEKGKIIPLNATANAGYIFAKWTINGEDTTDSLIYVTMDFDIVAVASFTSLGGILTTQIKVFDSIPVLKGNRYYFGDHSTKDNDVLIKNVKVAEFTTGYYINTNQLHVGGQPIVFDITLDFKVSTASRVLLSSGATTGTRKGINIYFLTGSTLRIETSNGITNTGVSLFAFTINELLNIHFEWSGITGEAMTVVINGRADRTYTSIANLGWSGNSYETVKISYPTNTFNSKIYKASLSNYFDYIFNHGQGAVAYNLLGGTDGTITGAVLSTFWGSNSDEAYPYDLTLGATLYQNNSDSTIMPICYNKPEAITGFTRLGWFPAGSGILRGLVNKYVIPVSVTGMPAGEYTESQIRALTPSTNIVKTETTNTISLLEGRMVE